MDAGKDFRDRLVMHAVKSAWRRALTLDPIVSVGS